jgi:hypothetical protein
MDCQMRTWTDSRRRAASGTRKGPSAAHSGDRDDGKRDARRPGFA